MKQNHTQYEYKRTHEQVYILACVGQNISVIIMLHNQTSHMGTFCIYVHKVPQLCARQPYTHNLYEQNSKHTILVLNTNIQ